MDNILPLDTYIPIYFETSFQNILEHAITTSQLNVPIKLAEKLGLGEATEFPIILPDLFEGLQIQY